MVRRQQATRHKSPSRLIRDKAIEAFARADDQATQSPQEKTYPDGTVNAISSASGMTRTRVYRWLDDPDAYPPTWPELTAIAEDIGGSLRALYSTKHPSYSR
jgi:hypothetical protein